MRRDVIFYQIFQRFPGLLFDLVDRPPPQAQRYRFESVEVKEPSFRIDGVFLPPDDVSPKIVFFAEVQFQKDDDLYHRFFCESFLYLYRNRAVYSDWRGIVIFPDRSLEPENTTMHQALLDSYQVQRIYLDELGDPNQQPIGISLMQLTTPCGYLEERAPEESAVDQARSLLQRADQNERGTLARDAIIEVVTTIAVYKFTNLSREEVESMLGLRLEDSRILQEAQRDKALAIVLRQLPRRVGEVNDALEQQVRQLSDSQLDDLSEALLDFVTVGDLVSWLDLHSISQEGNTQ